MNKIDWTAAKIDLFQKALHVAMSVPLKDVSIVSVSESTNTQVASKTIAVVTNFSLKSKVHILTHACQS